MSTYGKSARKVKITKGRNYEQIAKDGACRACGGSGYYDHHGSPKCSACNGTGKR